MKRGIVVKGTMIMAAGFLVTGNPKVGNALAIPPACAFCETFCPTYPDTYCQSQGCATTPAVCQQNNSACRYQNSNGVVNGYRITCGDFEEE